MVAAFSPAEGVTEYHIQFHVTKAEQTFDEQLQGLHNAGEILFETVLKRGTRLLMRRYLLSDAANQEPLLKQALKSRPSCPTSVVQQPPLDGTKVALCLYAACGLDSENNIPTHNGYTHYWSGENVIGEKDSEYQMSHLLAAYEERLKEAGCSIGLNCLRTWIFVQNIDVNYNGVVKGRRENFEAAGLTPKTHFIASTGIEGRHADPRVLVNLDTYAVKGLREEQVRFLYALSHLNPTYEYGVTFERGTAVEYGDRRHIFISGTASINNKGEVMYPGDVTAQTRRMCENVETLLREGGAQWGDVAMAIVYVRDTADYAVVRSLFQSEYPTLPCQFVLAPVCRPAWLIEMECIAIVPAANKRFNNF